MQKTLNAIPNPLVAVAEPLLPSHERREIRSMLACLSRLHHGHHNQIRPSPTCIRLGTSTLRRVLCVGLLDLWATITAHACLSLERKDQLLDLSNCSSNHASGPLSTQHQCASSSSPGQSSHPSAHRHCQYYCPAFLRPGVPVAAAKTHVPNRLRICIRTPVLFFPEGCMTIVDRVFISHQPHGNQARLSAHHKTGRTKIWGKPRVSFDYWGNSCYTIPRRYIILHFPIAENAPRYSLSTSLPAIYPFLVSLPIPVRPTDKSNPTSSCRLRRQAPRCTTTSPTTTGPPMTFSTPLSLKAPARPWTRLTEPRPRKCTM